TNIIAVQLADGAQKAITTQKWSHPAGIAWLSDGRGLIVSTGGGGTGDYPQIWLVSYPGGEATRITHDLTSYRGLSLTADSNTLATVQDERISNIWVAPNGDAGRARQITSGAGRIDGTNGLAWTPDG